MYCQLEYYAGNCKTGCSMANLPDKWSVVDAESDLVKCAKAVAGCHLLINFTVYVIMCELLSPRVHELVIGRNWCDILFAVTILLFLFAEVCSLDGRDAGGD